MLQLSRGAGVVALVVVLGACASQAQEPKPAATTGNAQALVLQDFRARVDKYVALHKQAAKKSPPLKESNDTAKIKAAQQILAETIQASRKDAKPGDIFTPEVRKTFRSLMYPELTGEEGRETKALIKEDAPTAVPLKVNSHYPEAQPLSTVPPNILARLPQLPEELDYRITGKHLLLRDADANLIVDYIPNAIQ